MRMIVRLAMLSLVAGASLELAPMQARAQNPAPAASAPATPPVAVPAGRTAAQDAAAAAGKNVSNSQIADAIKNSGLSEAQIRARLQAAGFDAKLADPFFVQGGAGGTGVAPAGAVDPTFLTALQALGIVEGTAEADEAKNGDNEPTKKSIERKSTASEPLGVFGKNVFTGGTAFDPVAGGPVDAGYRIGVSDQLQMVITGELETAAGLDVRRDGTIILPQIGQVSVAGLTLEAARVLLTRRAARVYSLIDAGRAHLDLTVSKVRNNQVFVIGEVERPGAYQVSALSTVFRALSAAGGPTTRGTYRNVEVRRAGAVVGVIDLYDYLLRGDASKDIRTEQGDIIFVGLSKRLVVLQGAVRRSSIYEMRPNEGFSDLLQFSGGLLPTAVTDRLQIDRVLPPAERAPGKERVVIDVPFNADYRVLAGTKVYDNDIITVFTIGDIRRNRIVLSGEVLQPGTYEWAPDMTLGSLIDKAQGFLPWALTDRVKVERPIVQSGRSEIFSLNVADSSSSSFPLREFDAVTVLDGRVAFPPGQISIAGAVYSPGDRSYFERETLKDAIDVANGLQPWAVSEQVILTRTNPATAKREQYSFDLRDSTALRFALRPFDRIDVLDARAATFAASVYVSGSVLRPGTRPWVERQTLKELIALQGGFKPEAASVDLASRRIGTVYNDTTAIARSFPILADGTIGGGGADVLLKRGDYVSVRDNPGYRSPHTVAISGLFTYPGTYVLERDGERISDVISRAGGLLPSAYAQSARLTRKGRPVAIDLRQALKGDIENNIQLEAGDQLTVGPNPSVVYVTGAVERSVVVPFRRGWSAAEYISAAGGFSADAEEDNILVEYPSGELRHRVKHRFYSTGDLTVISGSTVTVGRKPEEKPSNTSEALTRVVQLTTTLVSIFLAYKTATR